jgi:hypothetical protein
MKCKALMHAWNVALSQPVLKRAAIRLGSELREKRWFEVEAFRKCSSCGGNDIRTIRSRSWTSDTDRERAEELFQQGLTATKKALCGWEAADEQLNTLRKLISGTYSAIWPAWFQNTDQLSNAVLMVSLGDGSSVYHRELDGIEIAIQTGTPGEPGVFDAERWPSWKGELVHEMLHEYETKVPFKSSEEGIRLFRNSEKRFKDHPKDDTRYFTAVVEKATTYFHMEPIFMLRNYL